MKRLIVCVMIVVVLLSLTACEGNTPAESMPGVTGSPEQNAPVQKSDALFDLRRNMKPPVMAVADFGFPTLSDAYGILDYLQDEYPQWMVSHDFIKNITQERTIRTCGYEDWGNWVCIVPYDPKASVCVNVTRYTDTHPYEKVDVVYRSESGEPILLLANTSETVSVSVEIIDSEGRGAVWYPYWGNSYPIPEDGYYGALVMDFSPVSEKTAYDNAVDYGWTVPDASFLKDHLFRSDYGYELSLVYMPGEIYDGDAWIYEDDGYGVYETAYQGQWRYEEGKLYLDMECYTDGALLIQDAFPVLVDPYGDGWLGIFRTEDGVGLPQFFGDMEYDELLEIDISEDPYDYALNQGWRLPELWELLNTEWQSSNYAMDLMDDAVPDDNSGNAIIYDIDEIGAYTTSYTGTWNYEDGQLHLLLVPEYGDGIFVDDSFPVLMRDGELWIGRNEYGTGLPHFYEDQLADVLIQPMG